ncbi:hypothetical protein L5515_012254 [Caenorhabditis briggsae]|uniref:Peptidase M24 domain-containing protein n=1 Tax=Caenorhabditis briggsae TaxID=6238 RepID=A0AAE9EVH0_CAEBR|nr:hypothetical protein L5515_012254 [Caenorhabditis briggsae]
MDMTISHLLVGDKFEEETRKLVQNTIECLQQAIAIVKPGVKFREIGNVIQKHANANGFSKHANANGFSVVKGYCGHGIHRLFHTAPNAPHYANELFFRFVRMSRNSKFLENNATGVMKAGNSFTIEPMTNAGTFNDDKWPDDWTAVTREGKRSTQFEQTLLVTVYGS